MTEYAKVGMRVSADISGTRPGLVTGIVTPATIIGITPGDPAIITVRTDTPFNGETDFDVRPERVEPLR